MERLHSRVGRRSSGRGLWIVEIASLGVLVGLAGSVSLSHGDQLVAGKALYLEHCAVCHGEGGKGDGPMAEAMKAKSTDLTQIAKGAGGTFPSTKTMDVIGGTADIRAHGSQKMPVWGGVFRKEATSGTHKRGQAQSKIMLLTQYLQSIQEK